MEPSWTEPPPYTWVFIGAHERPECRRQGDATALRWPERFRLVVPGCEAEHFAQGRRIERSDQDRQ